MGRERRTREAQARLGRDFWFYFSGQAVSQLGGSFTTFALPLLVFKLTGSATNLALTTAAEFVPYLLFGLLLGAVVDRFDRKRLTAIPSLVGQRELVTANARIMATNNAGQILGPGLAGALVAFVPVPDLLFVDAGSFLVSSCCLALIRRSFNAATPATHPSGSVIRALLADVREGLAYVWTNPVLRSISIMMALGPWPARTRPRWSCGRRPPALACCSTSTPSPCARRSSRPTCTGGSSAWPRSWPGRPSPSGRSPGRPRST